MDDWFGEKRVITKEQDSPEIPARRKYYEYKEVV